MSGSHNLEIGIPGSNDVILYTEQLRKSNVPFGTVSHTFSYHCKDGEQITAVVARDMWTHDTGGDPELVNGGVGQRHVSIKVTSRWCRGFDFRFTVYGKRQSTSVQSSSGGISSADNWQYTTLAKNSDKIIEALAANGLSERLASSFKAQGMIGDEVYAKATNYAPNVTEYSRVKCLITAVQTSTRATPQRYHDFIKVLKSHSIRADAEAALVLLPTRAY